MTQSLPVHVSRETLHSLEVPASFEVEGPFDIRLINHGEALHIHLHLDDPLSEVADLDASNHYVEGNSERRVRIDVDTDTLETESLLGKLKVASAYGAETRWIDIEVTEPESKSQSVRVDESLTKPQPKEQPTSTLFDHPEIPVLALGIVALAVAILAAVVFQQILVVVGSLLVLGVVLVALVFLTQTQ